MAQQKTRRKRKKNSRNNSGGGSNTRTLILLLVVILAAVLFLLSRMLQDYTAEETAPSPSVSVSTAPSLPGSGLIDVYFGEENGYKSYSSDTVTAKLGVDLSSHQGSIDWSALAQSLVDFVILRAGYRGYGDGSVNIDELFSENLAAARNAGFGVGVYFFSQAISPEEAEEEARTVLSLLADYQIDYPIYFDWEPVSDENARTATISSSALTQCALRFCQTIEAAGYRAGVYFNLAMAQSYYHLTELQDYEFWLAEYQDIPSYPYRFEMWQYSNEGTVDGVSTTVDLNLCFKEYEG